MKFDDLDDLDDLESQPRAPARSMRFAPKTSRAAPNPPKPGQVPTPKIEAPPPKDEQLGTSAPHQDELELKPPVSGGAAYPKAAPSNSNGVASMEIELEPKAGTEMVKPMEEDVGCEEDEVVREIDVFLNPSIDSKTQLYVMQYPLRAWWRPYELDDRCEQVRVKPHSAELEVDLSIDVDTKNYDASSNIKMAKQTLSSTWKPPSVTSYAVGILDGNKLHLNPINAIVQLRPSMEHLHPEGLKMKSNITAKAQGDFKTEGAEKAGPSRKQSKQSEPITNAEEEHWVPLVYHGSNSDLSANYVRNMVAQQYSPIPFAMSPHDYVNSLCPGATPQNVKPEGSSRRDLHKLPFEERMKKLLCEEPYAHRYSALRSYCPDVSEDKFSTILQDNAMLVQGCWVAKTSLLDLDNRKQEPLARDYILLLFSKAPLILNSALLSKSRVEVMKKFLNIFAVERVSMYDWKFKQPTDVSFLKSHPNIVKSQTELWAAREENIMKYILKGRSNSRDGSMTNNAARMQSSVPFKDAKDLKNNRTAAQAAIGTAMPPETRVALRNSLQKVFQKQKVCSYHIICEEIRGLAVSQAGLSKANARMAKIAAKAVESPQELKEVLEQVAFHINGFYVLRSSTEHPEHDALRKVVVDLLIGKGPKATLRRAEIVEAAKMVLKRDISENEYDKVIYDLLESKGSSWVLKSGS